MNAIWRMYLLGELRVEALTLDLPPVVRFRTQKAAMLLAYLALHPGPQPRETLCALLWPDALPEVGRNNLSVALSSLRHQLEPPELPVGCVFIADRQSLGIRVGALETDVAPFVARPSIESYGGMLLPGFYEDWILLERSALTEIFRGLVRTEAAGLAPERRAELAREAARKDPDNLEEFATWLPVGGPSKTSHASPVRAQVLPSPEPARAEFLCPLPLYPTRFFGRSAESAHLRELLEQSRLVTVVGLGGMGKTRLVLEALRERPEVLFIPMAERTHVDTLIPAIRSALRLAPATDETENLIQALQARPTTLVLDNLEHLLGGIVGPIYHLLSRVESLKIVATSRRALSLPGESLLTLAPLPLESAMALFTDRARAVLPDFHVSAHNAQALRSLCQRLDGIPLAIELAASRARILTPGQWLKRLESGLDAVAATSRTGVPERHKTLLAALRWSYDLLEEPDQQLLVRLAVFRGGWSLEAAEELAQDPLTLDRLATLADSSLITSTLVEGKTLRFSLLETIREFARSISSEAQVQADRARHAAFFSREAAQQAARLKSKEASEARHWFETERDNLRVALDSAQRVPALDATQTMALAAALGRFWELDGAFQEAIESLSAVLELEGGESRDRSTMLIVLGNIAHNRGELSRAESLLRACLALREAESDDQGAAMALNNLSLIHAQRAQYDQARTLANQAVEAYLRGGSAREAAVTQVNLGNLYGYSGDWEAAERVYRAAAMVLERERELGALASVYANLCACAAHRGDLHEAERYARQSVSLKEELGDKFGRAQSLDTLAEVLSLQERHTEARAALRQSLTLLAELEAWRTLPYNLMHMAQLDRNSYPERAAQLLGAMERIQTEDGTPFPSGPEAGRAALEQALTEKLGSHAFSKEKERGARLTRLQAVALAQEDLNVPSLDRVG